MDGSAVVETFVPAGDGVRLCVQSLGDPAAPPLLLIAGAAASLDWWDDGFCARLVDRGLRVVRYDHRDTGRSTMWPAGAPGYGGAALTADALAVLDGLGIRRAHVLGLSMGGGIAQELGLWHRDRVASLTLVATSAVLPLGVELPDPTAAVQAAMADPPPEPDWTDRDAVIAHIVASERAFAGPDAFDEERVRALAGRVFDRSTDVRAALTNHWVVVQGDGDRAARPPRTLDDLAGIPTLVVHGTADPLFPVEHGRALAAAIPGATLIELDGAGHQEPPPAHWDTVAAKVAENARGPA